MLVILKIPVVYMCAIVWWAIRAEPQPLDGAERLALLEPPPSCDWRRRTLRPVRPLRGGGRPVRSSASSRAAAGSRSR